MQRFLADSGFTYTVEEVTEGEEAGIKSATFSVKGTVPTERWRRRGACIVWCASARSTPTHGGTRPLPRST